MRDSYVQNLIKISGAEKTQINAIYNAALKTSQEMFLESSLLHEHPVFDVLEGKVCYDKNLQKGVFYPNKHLLALLEESSSKKRSNLFEKNISRFTALLMHAYKDFNDSNADAFKTWISTGHEGNESDFLKWIIEKSNEEKQ